MNISRRFKTLIIISISVVFILLRLWDLTTSCLWFDEIFSIHAAEHSWDTIFSFIAQDLIHPPLFYVFLKLWMSIGGESLFWLRLFPVFFSIVTFVPFLLVCRELKLKFWTIFVALSFFAVNGSLIKYAQEVRMYSLLLCLSLFSMWLFSRFFHRGKNIWLLTLINILLVYTHYFGWFVVLSEVIATLILQRIKIRHVLLMFALTFVSFIPWIVAVVQAANTGADVKQNIGWIASPGLARIFEFVFDVIEPFYFQQSSAEATSNFYIAVPVLLLIGAAKIIYLINWKDENDKSAFYLLSIFSIVPIVTAFIASWLLPVSIWGSRHLIIVYVPMMLLSAIFLTQVKIRSVKIAFSALLIGLFAVAFAIRINTKQQQFIWCAWEDFAAEVQIKEKDKTTPMNIYVFEELVAYHFWFALRNSDKVYVNVVKGIDGMTEDTAYFLPRGFDGVQKTDENGIEVMKLWTAFRAPEWNEKDSPLSNLINRGYEVEKVREFDISGQKAFLVTAINNN